jgi:uncharacterized protein YecE (DUF72 family)
MRIGTAGWAIPRAHAQRAPGDGSHLERYSRALNCAEINSTFYRPSRPSTLMRWADAVPDGFRFAMKAPKAISHEAALELTAECKNALASFLEQASLLGEKLGPILFQFPPKQAFDHAKTSAFLDHFRKQYSGPAVFEPRHASWFSDEAEALLARYGVARAAADPPRVDAGSQPGGAASLIYYRLHGSPRIYYSAYSAEYLTALAKTIAQYPPEAEVWVIFDNTASAAGFGDAIALQQMFESGRA